MAISAIVGAPFVLVTPVHAAAESARDGLPASDHSSDPASESAPVREQIMMSTTVFPFRFDKPGTECVVLPGDTLSTVAHRYLVAGGWQAIYHRNIEIISDPDIIHPGQRLTLR